MMQNNAADVSPAKLNWLDRSISFFAPGAAVKRFRQRVALAALTGYEAANPGRKRKFHRNTQSGDSLARVAAVPLRNQARHLERINDISRGILDKLVDFTVGPNGISIEPQPKNKKGELHREFAKRLQQTYAKWSEWPEVTWTHDRAAAERLAARTWFRDGEVLGQLVTGKRNDLVYGSSLPVAIEMIEADLLPHDLEDQSKNIRQGIERNTWGRPSAYHLYKTHPGDDRNLTGLQTKRVPAEQMLHVRLVDRIGQLRGITVFASIIERLQDIHEYEDSERLAAKMAADMVLKITHGSPEMWDAQGGSKYDPNSPPVYRMDGGMVVVNTAPGETADFFDTKRPNLNGIEFVEGHLRRVASGTGLSYSSVSRNYNGTYSAQRQELVENWPHYHALTGTFVAQWTRPTWQQIVAWELLTNGIPADLDVATAADALFLGPPMPWIDPEKEANAQLILVQACFKSSSQVIRERGRVLEDTYQQLKHEHDLREQLGLTSSTELNSASVSQAKPTPPPAPTNEPGQPQKNAAGLRVVKS